MDREVPDRIVKEIERRHLTGVSRSQWWRLEQKGVAPSRLRIGSNAVGWRLSDLMQWIDSLPPVAGCSKPAFELRSKIDGGDGMDVDAEFTESADTCAVIDVDTG